jgi:alpha-N-arabinofuranosidase
MASHRSRRVVVMDKEKPFVGDQSPRIELDSATPHGIRQSGLALVKGKQYTGRIYLRGTPGSKVKVSLIWGAGENDRQTITIPALTNEYKKFPLSFTAKADTADGVIEITGTGRATSTSARFPDAGRQHSGIPARHDRAAAPDQDGLLAVWRQLHLRLIWYHIVGDIDKRPPDFDYAWNAMQTNDLGLDEFMTLCKLIGVEPYISVNAGFGDSHSAAEEVEYMNGSVNTHMGASARRTAIPNRITSSSGTSATSPGDPGSLAARISKYFMLKHNEFAKAMRASGSVDHADCLGVDAAER